MENNQNPQMNHPTPPPYQGPMKTCKHCNANIPQIEKKCQYCGHGQGGIIKWVIIGFFAICIIGAAASGEDDNKNKEKNTSKTENSEKLNNESQENSKTEDIKTEKPSKEKKEEDNIFHKGEILETKKVKLSYLSCGDYFDNNMYIEAGEGNKLIYFEFEFENIGNTDISAGYFDFDCYADGYDAQNKMSTADNAMKSITTLSPGRKMSGIVVFEVPQGASKIEVEYETSYWTQDKAIFIFE